MKVTQSGSISTLSRIIASHEDDTEVKGGVTQDDETRQLVRGKHVKKSEEDSFQHESRGK